jgi:hypothetical protein
MGSTKNYRARSQTMQVGKPPIYQTKYFSLQQKKEIKLKTDKSRKYYCTTRVNIRSQIAVATTHLLSWNKNVNLRLVPKLA